MCVCVQIKELHQLILRICVAQSTKCFPGILLYLSFSVVSDFKDNFLCLGWNVRCSVSSISMITYSMLLMIGHVREIRHMY